MKREEHKRAKELKRVWVPVVISLLLVIVLFTVFLNYEAIVGKAFQVEVDGQTWTSPVQGQSAPPIDLTTEGSFIFVDLPEEEDGMVTVPFVMVTPPATGFSNYQFTLQKKDSSTYRFTFPDQNQQDLITPGEVIPVYLDIADAKPDIEVSFLNNQITVKNLHYISPDVSTITLLNQETNVAYPPLIRVSGETFQALVKAASSSPPALSVTMLGQTIDLGSPEVSDNEVTQELRWNVPATPTKAILDIAATVNTLTTLAYYALIVGTTALQLQEDNFPVMALQFTGSAGNAAQLQVIFKPTTNLQPLALPCTPTIPLPTIFERVGVERVYSYGQTAGQGMVQAWNPNPEHPSDFTSFTSMRGYFVKLSEQTAAATDELTRTITMPCTIPSIVPGTTSTLSIPAGFTLFTLPGVIPLSITDFTPATNFKIFGCSNGGCDTTPLTITTPLQPGKVYWIHTATPFTVTYNVQ